jgi:hypothetical protein
MGEGCRRRRIVYGCCGDPWAGSLCGRAEAIRKEGFVVKDLNGCGCEC